MTASDFNESSPQVLDRTCRIITLADGTNVFVRVVLPTDQAALIELVGRCNPYDRRFRFFDTINELEPSVAAKLCETDGHLEVAFVAFERASGEMIGIVRLSENGEANSAEFSLLIRSDKTGHGLGHQMMLMILNHARRNSVTDLHGEIMPENGRMLDLAKLLGFKLAFNGDGGRYVTASINLH